MAVTTKSKKANRSTKSVSSSLPTKSAFLQNITTGPARIALVVAGLVLITIGIFMIQKKVADDYVKESANITKAYESIEPTATVSPTTTVTSTVTPTMTTKATPTITPTPTSTPKPTVTPTPVASQPGKISDQAVSTINNTYTVKSGDTLWSIAERTYGTGYDWKKIAETNKLSSPSSIKTGMTLLLPQANQTLQPTGTAAKPSPSNQPTPANTTVRVYTAVHGDTLWSIAEKFYNDGNQWPKIAKANDLANPRIIHSGNTFVIP